MFLSYYKLAEQPFGVTPDSRFLYLSPKHREAFASLVYGTETDRGFLALIAEPGMGKTSLLYHYLDHVQDKARTAFVFRTDCDPREFIRYVLIDLGVDTSGMDMPTMHDTLNRLLVEGMEAGRRFVLVIDEAQALKDETLESIRLLSNFETPWVKLMLIVLAGQPQLANHLARPALSQLRQRISMVIPIEPFNQEEVNAYIDHRLRIAGGENPALFTLDARSLIAEYSRGIPRNINNICFNALSLGCALHRETIDRDIIREVIADLDLEPLKQKSEITVDLKPEPLKETSRVAERVETAQKQADPILPNASKRKSVSSGAIPRITILSMLLLVPLGSAKPLNRNESRDIDLLSSAAPRSSVLLDPARSADNAEGWFEQSDNSVGRTSRQIGCRTSVKKTDLGNSEVSDKNPGLNPWQTDTGCIQGGQEFPVPSATITSGDIERPTQRVRNTPPTEKEKP